MYDKGLHISIGVKDSMRDPSIQSLCDNLEIARRRFKIHAGKINKDDILPYVSFKTFSEEEIYDNTV